MKVAAIEQKTQVPSELLSASRFFDINSRERTFSRALLRGKKENSITTVLSRAMHRLPHLRYMLSIRGRARNLFQNKHFPPQAGIQDQEQKRGSSFRRFVSRFFVEGGKRRKRPEGRGRRASRSCLSNLIHIFSTAFSFAIRFEMKAQGGNVDRRISDVYCLRFCYHKNKGPFGPLTRLGRGFIFYSCAAFPNPLPRPGPFSPEAPCL